jgi:magnesium-protoporphyrin O-methyltransferase
MRISSASNLALVGVVVAVASSVDAFSSSSSSLHASSLISPTKSTTTFLLAASENSAIDDKTEVRDYFNNEGFNRWNKIYSNSDEVNTVQLDIRKGHDMTISKIINWIKDDGNIAGKTVCDCGCGVGSLAIPLAQMGAVISASDISSSMANEAAERANNMGITNAKFYTSDLESVTGKYNTVTCVDVAIHYPTDKMAQMIGHLCSLADERVMISFAPKTWYYEILKKIGEFFPGPSKTTRAYLHDEVVVREALSKAGFRVAREEMTGTSFYFSRLLEAKRV